MRHASRIAALALCACGLSPAAAQAPVTSVPATTPAPLSAQQSALGRRLAAAGDFNAIIGAMGRAEIESMATNTPDLTEPERAIMRRLGGEVLAAGRARILAVVGDAYARHFSADQLVAILAFLESPAGRAYIGALPHLLPQIGGAMQGVDLGRDVRAAFCRETGKLCEAS
jgi:hypothetical protein